jgi:hypothetical protein
MSQHDMDIANAVGATVRPDINNALVALVTNSSGASAPATTFAYQWWADTTTGILKQRNAANSAWISILTLSTGTPVGHVIGTDIQAYDAALLSLAALSLVQGDLVYATAADTYARLAKGTAAQQLRMNAGATAPEWFTPTAGGMTLATMQATTAGTAITFGSIPAGTKRITVMFDEVSTNSSASQLILRIGDSGGLETSGYASAGGSSVPTDGFSLTDWGSSADRRSGIVVLNLMDAATFKWVCGGTLAITNAPNSQAFGGVKSLSAELTQLSITTSAGTATFDNGNINIAYE